ncbi:hypothetical protein IEQ34_007076 [Dendrobium chrysotoxum]|uniref:Uncharacterized protein n=1 Tax=Dendrobium chrysotoxum TaxID=161865 RepID=A0AAV7H8B4_DENCH|nr:hypothetical protein IEQ34_007076 [Dendrobium chrysotoxum]
MHVGDIGVAMCVDDDLITAIADDQYVLKGSLFPSLTKTMDPFVDREKSPSKQEAEEREQLKIDDNIWSSEVMNSTDRFFRIGSIWLKEKNQGEDNSSVTVAKKKMIESELIKSDSNGRKATNVMRNFIGCMTVETKGSALRAAHREDSSVAGSSHGSNSSKSAR